jgi:hypothetical protein
MLGSIALTQTSREGAVLLQVFLGRALFLWGRVWLARRPIRLVRVFFSHLKRFMSHMKRFIWLSGARM